MSLDPGHSKTAIAGCRGSVVFTQRTLEMEFEPNLSFETRTALRRHKVTGEWMRAPLMHYRDEDHLEQMMQSISEAQEDTDLFFGFKSLLGQTPEALKRLIRCSGTGFAAQRGLKSCYSGVEVGVDGEPLLKLAPSGELVSPILLMALLFKQLIDDGRTYLRLPESEAVLYVLSAPMGSLLTYRQDIVAAVKAVIGPGSRVAVIPEPLAAYLAAVKDGLTQSNARIAEFLIVDIGHHTLDLVAVLQERDIEERTITCRILKYGGKADVGGAYVNMMIVQFVLGKLRSEHFKRHSGWIKYSDKKGIDDLSDWVMTMLGFSPACWDAYLADQADLVKKTINAKVWSYSEFCRGRPSVSGKFRFPKGSWSILPPSVKDYIEKDRNGPLFYDAQRDYFGYAVYGSDYTDDVLGPYLEKIDALKDEFVKSVQGFSQNYQVMWLGGGSLVKIPDYIYDRKKGSRNGGPPDMEAIQRLRKTSDAVCGGALNYGQCLQDGFFLDNEGFRVILYDICGGHIGVEYTSKGPRDGLFNPWVRKGDTLPLGGKKVQPEDRFLMKPGEEYHISLFESFQDIPPTKCDGLPYIASQKVIIPDDVPVIDNGYAVARVEATISHDVQDVSLFFHGRTTPVTLRMKGTVPDSKVAEIGDLIKDIRIGTYRKDEAKHNSRDRKRAQPEGVGWHNTRSTKKPTSI